MVVAVFASSNRQSVVLSFYPLPYEIGVPLYLLFFGLLMVGIVLGAMLTFVQGRYWKAEAKEKKKQIKALEQELSGVRVEQKLLSQQ
jgi:uncharacterized integral membrane protein